MFFHLEMNCNNNDCFIWGRLIKIKITKYGYIVSFYQIWLHCVLVTKYGYIVSLYQIWLHCVIVTKYGYIVSLK